MKAGWKNRIDERRYFEEKKVCSRINECERTKTVKQQQSRPPNFSTQGWKDFRVAE